MVSLCGRGFDSLQLHRMPLQDSIVRGGFLFDNNRKTIEYETWILDSNGIGDGDAVIIVVM